MRVIIKISTEMRKIKSMLPQIFDRQTNTRIIPYLCSAFKVLKLSNFYLVPPAFEMDLEIMVGAPGYI